METDATADRLSTIEARLAKIENRLGLAAAPVQAPPAVPFKPVPKPVPAAASIKPGNWLGAAAVVCFVLAAGFIVKLSIDTGWLTPARQIGLAALLGFALIGAGLALLKSDRGYASLLPGAGVIVLYLTVFAAHRLYGLIAFQPALVVVALISALCIALYVKIRHDAYAITAAVGAYVSPVVLALAAAGVFSLYYFLLCSIAFATISVWLRSRALTMVSAYLALFVSGAIGILLNELSLTAWLLAAHFLIFSIGTTLYSIRNRAPLNPVEAWSLFPVLLLFYALEYFLIYQIDPGLAPWISLGFAGVLIGLYLSARRLFPDGLDSQALILAFATVAVFHSVYLELLTDTIRPWLFAPIVLGAAFLSPRAAWRMNRNPFALPMVALLLIAAIQYVGFITDLYAENNASLAAGFFGFASLWIVLAFAPVLRDEPPAGYALLGAAHLLAILGAYRLTHATSSLAVSASWLFYAVAVLAFGYVRKDKVMAHSALVVLGFAGAKALLYDAASAPTVVRIFCLLLTGIVLYGCGLFMRRVNNWDAATSPSS